MPTLSKTPEEAGEQLTRDELSWGAELGQTVTVSYGFRASAPSYNSASHNQQGTFTPLSPTDIDAVSRALNLWADVANINLIRADDGDGYSDQATILFGNYSSTSDGHMAFAYYPDPQSTAGSSQSGDVWLNHATSICHNFRPATNSSLWCMRSATRSALNIPETTMPPTPNR